MYKAIRINNFFFLSIRILFFSHKMYGKELNSIQMDTQKYCTIYLHVLLKKKIKRNND